MKTCAIINFWDGAELINYCVNNWLKCVDHVIICFSQYSNYGEYKDNEAILHNKFKSVVGSKISKSVTLHARHGKEVEKRNFGLELARGLGFTHFVTSDCDEFYDPEEFKIEKQRFIDNPNLQGLVCGCRVYVKSPSLTVGMDTTRVPFIHKITPTLKHEFNRNYPFAWEGRAIRIDPTRAYNINSGVEWSPILMDHYSYVRADILEKIRNSAAKANIERTNIAKNFFHLKEGDICELYPGKPLVRVPVKYGLPEFYGSSAEDLQSIPSGS